jgi:uncharacterized membrane protein (DUF4010 family)
LRICHAVRCIPRVLRLPPVIPDIFQRLGISLGLGLLVGLQRERVASRIGGIRTFPLITLFGSLCALLSQPFGAWVIAGGALAVAAILVTANLVELREGQTDPGQTTEVAALLMFAVGAYVMVGSMAAAVAVGAVTAVLLQFKDPLHRFVHNIGDQDALAIMQFVLISLVILPVLPDQSYGPGEFKVFNPRKIWLMVVLIVGISLAGYVAYKLLGKNAGTLLGGVLGGLVSSTATTVSYSRRTKHNPGRGSLALVVIMVASTVAFARVIVEIGAVAPQSFGRLAPPLLAMFGFMIVLSLLAWRLAETQIAQLPEQGNPAQFKSALVFAALYAVVLLAVAVARTYFGNRGLYAVGMISGLTDMDAITLSTAQLADQSKVAHATAWKVILLAGLANLLFKGGAVAMLGSRGLLTRIAFWYGAAIAGGAIILLLWPEAWTLDGLTLPSGP